MTTTLASLPWNTSPITDEATWRAYMRLARGTGVIPEDPTDPEVLNGFLVYADSTGMQVKIKSGTAWMRGVYAPNPAEVIEAISAAHATLHRIDRVALKLDTVNHTVAITVVTGTPAASPVAPTLTNTTSIYYVTLAQVYVTAAVTTIAADKVTDERSYSDRAVFTKVSRSTLQTIPNATNTPISFDTEQKDTDGMWSVGSPTVLTIPFAGVYVFGGNVQYAANVTGSRETLLRVNGSTVKGTLDSRPALTGLSVNVSLTTITELAAGDTIDLVVWQNSGGDLNISAVTPSLWTAFLGA